MADLKKQSIEDLQKSIADMRERLREFRFSEAGTRTRNVREGRTLRREIARALTELRMREIDLKRQNA
ncbi:50S ribosomal protein L29 [Candidatus Kaiserbacteria bacterium CG10_big_fil_rev_8_21_14_0_10_59_10]|uniref:Large ribosomal subunit protein uL29 n=1 Tax=Candidatus Kaiserbacteria bacterium CG10_big_fil_rev_8_21_14_0_10_59_10 TaxID=1974612 RepID=A0A2H0U8V5_9BACT|nr:MAG: 50S ribosomal protein L29 [Candidatus Kaiserbacteria bacterium CG10_big_fil_rev_8_21_14_0_10_59_10]